ncbi:MAG: hypothetical protein Q3980_10315 [Turicibacter sp.]|nr:hypothetical protein [Turicibacter sp.]MDO5794529.1 hypothetical protein [Turicibacter sp.]
MNKLIDHETYVMIYLLQLLSYIDRKDKGILDSKMDNSSNDSKPSKIGLEDYPVDLIDSDVLLE